MSYINVLIEVFRISYGSVWIGIGMDSSHTENTQSSPGIFRTTGWSEEQKEMCTIIRDLFCFINVTKIKFFNVHFLYQKQTFYKINNNPKTNVKFLSIFRR